MNNSLQTVRWSENVILADADYIDKVAFNLIVNFERMLGRRIPQADMARWIDCVALDGDWRTSCLAPMRNSTGKPLRIIWESLPSTPTPSNSWVRTSSRRCWSW